MYTSNPAFYLVMGQLAVLWAGKGQGQSFLPTPCEHICTIQGCQECHFKKLFPPLLSASILLLAPAACFSVCYHHQVRCWLQCLPEESARRWLTPPAGIGASRKWWESCDGRNAMPLPRATFSTVSSTHQESC